MHECAAALDFCLPLWYNIFMSVITEITAQKKGDRLNIFLDGEFAFGVSYATAVKFGLKSGKTLNGSDIDAINAEEGNVAAFERGLKYAVKKTVSVRQMREYLGRNGFSLTAIDLAIDKLSGYGYVDDMKFAKAYVNTYSSERGKLRIVNELKKAGVSESIIAEATADMVSAIDGCIDKFLRTHAADKNKLVNYLMYRGFEWDEISEAVSRREI